MFGTDDLFVAGLGFDIAGAWLLARGLLASPSEIALRTAQLWGGNPATTAAELEDSVSGSFGLSALLFGFVVQGISYAISAQTDDPTTGTWVGVAIAAAVPILATLAVEKLTHGWRLDRLIVEVSKFDADTKRLGKTPIKSELERLAEACGREVPDVHTDQTTPDEALG